MWKKWFNIILAVWLINSVTYFHSSNPFNYADESHAACSTSDCIRVNTWLDCLIQQVTGDEGSDPASKAHKIKYQRRYVNTRTLNFSVFLSPQLFYLPAAVLKRVIRKDTNHYSIGVALLPAYYNFLFRLSPF